MLLPPYLNRRFVVLCISFCGSVVYDECSDSDTNESTFRPLKFGTESSFSSTFKSSSLNIFVKDAFLALYLERGKGVVIFAVYVFFGGRYGGRFLDVKRELFVCLLVDESSPSDVGVVKLLLLYFGPSLRL